MRSLLFSLILMISFSACEQFSQSNGKKDNSVAETTIYKGMSTELCDCISSTLGNNRPSLIFDSCYNSVLQKNTNKLMQAGIDAKTQNGQFKISNELVHQLFTICSGTYALFRNETEGRKLNTLFFKGMIASQKTLPGGEIEITMINTKTKESKTFKSRSFVEDPSKNNSNTLSYEVTVEYEIKHNAQNNKDEYYLKENAPTSAVSIQKAERKN